MSLHMTKVGALQRLSGRIGIVAIDEHRHVFTGLGRQKTQLELANRLRYLNYLLP